MSRGLRAIALSDLGLVYSAMGLERKARAVFEREVRLQPSNSQSWDDLANFELSYSNTARAKSALQTELYLNPWSPGLKKLYLEQLR